MLVHVHELTIFGKTVAFISYGCRQPPNSLISHIKVPASVEVKQLLKLDHHTTVYCCETQQTHCWSSNGPSLHSPKFWIEFNPCNVIFRLPYFTHI